MESWQVGGIVLYFLISLAIILFAVNKKINDKEKETKRLKSLSKSERLKIMRIKKINTELKSISTRASIIRYIIEFIIGAFMAFAFGIFGGIVFWAILNFFGLLIQTIYINNKREQLEQKYNVVLKRTYTSHHYKLAIETENIAKNNSKRKLSNADTQKKDEEYDDEFI